MNPRIKKQIMKSEEEYERIKKKLKMLEKESKNNYFLEYEKNLLELNRIKQENNELKL